ncbi:MAG: DNA-binding domain-containing protein [Pseudomonadota bacterium]
MLSLRETQLAFASSILGSDAHSMRGLILERRFSTEERLRVYRNNARIGFHAALRAAFPVIEQLGGTDWFESAAHRYQQQHPSCCGDLQYVGEFFAQFLRDDLSATSFKWFADVAQLEWYRQEVLVAADSPVLDPATLTSLAPEQQELAIILPRTELRLLQTRVPVLSIWKAHQPGADSTEFKLDDTERDVLIIRRAEHVELRELPPEPALLLDAFLHDGSLLRASQKFVDTHPEADLGGALLQLMQRATLSAIHVPHH